MTTGHWFVKINVIGKKWDSFLTGTDVFGVSEYLNYLQMMSDCSFPTWKNTKYDLLNLIKLHWYNQIRLVVQ